MMNQSTSENFARKSSSHRLANTDVSQSSIYVELDKEVEKLRKVLDDPLRVAQVSSVGFPLQVWERMFALDREQRAARAVQQQEQQQRQVDGGDDDDDVDDDDDDENEEASANHVNKQVDEGKRSASRRSPSRASSSAHSSGFTSGLNLKRKAPILRNCRENKMNAKFMHDLVRETVFGKNSQKVVDEEGAAENEQKKSISEEIVIPRKRNLFLLEEEGDGAEIIQRNQQIIDKTAKNEFQAKAVLRHIEVPSRVTLTEKSSPVGNTNSNNEKNNNRNNISSMKEHQIDDPRKNKASSSADLKNTTSSITNNNKNNNKIVIADKPIRAFAPVCSLWGAIGGSTVAAAEQQKQQARLQAMSRPVVERHDLPFEVTPANDFRQLAFPLVGLGHAVPYGDLLHEQQSMINMCKQKVGPIGKVEQEK